MDPRRTFPGIRENETVKLWIHKHWIVHFHVFFYTIILGGGLTLFLTQVFTYYFAGMAFLQIILFLLTIYLIGVWLWAYLRWIDEDFDCVIITDQRIIDITQNGLFSLSVSETSLDLVQDVRGTINGFWGNIFHYGDIAIQTAARDRVFQMSHVAHSGKIVQTILNEKEAFLSRNGERTAQTNTPKIKSQT